MLVVERSAGVATLAAEDLAVGRSAFRREAMSIEKRDQPNVDRLTPELEALLAQFSDEEIASGVVARVAALGDGRRSVEALIEQLNDARRRSPQG